MILESGKTLADYNIQKLTNVKVPFKRKKESKQAFHKLKSVGRRSNDSFGSRTNPSDSEPQYQQPKQHVTGYDFEFHAKNPGFVFDPKQNKWFNLQCPNPNYLGKHFDLRKAKSQRLPSSLNLSSQTIWELNRESSQAKRAVEVVIDDEALQEKFAKRRSRSRQPFRGPRSGKIWRPRRQSLATGSSDRF